jgi:hypothetical protein
MRMKAQMIIPLVVGFPPDYNVLGNYNMWERKMPECFSRGSSAGGTKRCEF